MNEIKKCWALIGSFGLSLFLSISGTVNSPQFQQALSLFSSAFQSAQLAPLIREFDLGTEAVEAATKGDLETFVKALQKSASKKKDDAPEDMALDWILLSRHMMKAVKKEQMNTNHTSE